VIGAFVSALCLLTALPAAPASGGLPDLAPPQPNELLPPHLDLLLRRFEQPPAPWAAGHRGVDIAVIPGSTRLRAPAAGRLTTGVTVGNRWVTIEVPTGSLRVTLSYLETVLVAHNTQVRAGEVVAIAGLGHGDGAVEGHHVHLSTRVPDVTDPSGWRYVDPMPPMRRYLRRVRGSVTQIRS